MGISAAIVTEADATSDIQTMYAHNASLTNTDGKFLPNHPTPIHGVAYAA